MRHSDRRSERQTCGDDRRRRTMGGNPDPSWAACAGGAVFNRDNRTPRLVCCAVCACRRFTMTTNESESRYHDCFENTKYAIYVHDLNGRYTMVNKSWRSADWLHARRDSPDERLRYSTGSVSNNGSKRQRRWLISAQRLERSDNPGVQSQSTLQP